jgi:hypothetical protein
LKIKIKSLAEEAKIIRHEVNKASKLQKYYTSEEDRCSLGNLKYNLNEHKKGIVRHESRHALLAYAIIRNIPYEKLEAKCNEAPYLKKVSDMARRFGAAQDVIEEWIKNAKEYLKGQGNE